MHFHILPGWQDFNVLAGLFQIPFKFMVDNARSSKPSMTMSELMLEDEGGQKNNMLMWQFPKEVVSQNIHL